MDNTKVTCVIDEKPCDPRQAVLISSLDQGVQNLIYRKIGKEDPRDFICLDHLFSIRMYKLAHMRMQDKNENNKISRRFSRIMASRHYQITNLNEDVRKRETTGDKVADILVRFCGSWKFILFFGVVVSAWVAVNSVPVLFRHFDPYPFIFLNLFLSIMAALQAPLIMMSQNRAAEHDRMQAENDFKVNNKSEAEIRLLHSKLDHLIENDQPNTFEAQKMQMQLLGEIQKEIQSLNKQNEYLTKKYLQGRPGSH